MSLSELYSEEVNQYRKTGKLQVEPSQVLSMLLLDKKDDFFPTDVNIEHFYHDYKNEINADALKVEDDFNLESPKDNDKFWETYGSAIEVLFDGITQMSLMSGEDVYQYCYGEVEIKILVKKIGGIK